MEKRTIRRLRGAVQLVTDGIEAAAEEAQRVHETIARRPYALLERVEPIAGPVRVLGSVQAAITAIAYGAVRAGNAIAGAVVTTAIGLLEPDSARPGDARGTTPERR